MSGHADTKLTARQRVDQRLPGFRKIITEMRDSGDPDRLADAAYLLGLFDDIAEVGAESLAKNQRLREALERALHRLTHVDGKVLLAIYDAQVILREALAGDAE